MPTAGKPNIIMIMADDVGIWHVSAYHRGMMGGRTPNIDRLAREGALFTDYYGQQSCTAQSGLRLARRGEGVAGLAGGRQEELKRPGLAVSRRLLAAGSWLIRVVD